MGYEMPKVEVAGRNIPLDRAIERARKILANPRTPKQFKPYWEKKLKEWSKMKLGLERKPIDYDKLEKDMAVLGKLSLAGEEEEEDVSEIMTKVAKKLPEQKRNLRRLKGLKTRLRTAKRKRTSMNRRIRELRKKIRNVEKSLS